jgi:hypothetical protein
MKWLIAFAVAVGVCGQVRAAAQPDADGTRAAEGTEAPAAARAGYDGLVVGMSMAEIGKIKMRRLKCEPPRAGGSRCSVGAKPKLNERTLKAIFVGDTLGELVVDFRDQWVADFDVVSATYARRYGPSAADSSGVQVPFGPYTGQYLRQAGWSPGSGGLVHLSCRGPRPSGICQSYSLRLLGPKMEDLMKIHEAYGE